jgi:hypothetical protein
MGYSLLIYWEIFLQGTHLIISAECSKRAGFGLPGFAKENLFSCYNFAGIIMDTSFPGFGVALSVKICFKGYLRWLNA